MTVSELVAVLKPIIDKGDGDLAVETVDSIYGYTVKSVRVELNVVVLESEEDKA